jgi:hypothetical protein
MRPIRLATIVGVLSCGLFAATSIRAQDPFADPAPGAAAPMPPMGEADPFGGASAPGAAPIGGADPTKREPFVIQQIRDSKPTTPAELMRAAQATWQFGRPDEAKRYLGGVLAAKPAEAELAALEAPFADFVIKLTTDKTLQPEGPQVAAAILTASQKQIQNPDRINALIAQLSNEDLGARQDALAQLADSGPHIVTPALRVLADASREKEHRYIRAALAHLKTSTELPLLGALEMPSDFVRAQVILVLGRMGSQKALLHLVRPAVDPTADEGVRQAAIAALTKIVGPIPDRYEAERYLELQTARLLKGQITYAANHENLVELWYWDESKREVLPTRLSREDAAVMLAARAANDLYALRASAEGEHSDAVHADATNRALRLKLLTNLELAKVLGGIDQPLAMSENSAGALALAAGPQEVSQVLTDALDEGRIPAAIAAAEVLGQIGDPSVLFLATGHLSPLARAMYHPDRRVRLAAALACVKLAPGQSFSGASRVAETLGWVASTSGSSYVLVGHPRGEDAQTLVGYMNELGYDGQAAYIGRTLAEQAFVNPDFEFVLVGDAIDLPPVFELVQWLRRDYRTARLPVGVMARNDQLDRFQFAFKDDPFTIVFPRLHSAAVASIEVDRLRAIAGRNLVGRDERIAQAQTALATLARLAENDANYDPYQLLRQEQAVIGALNNPALTVEATAVLAQFATPKSQSALVDFASQATRDLGARQAASTAFAAAVQRRGLRLTQQQIIVQYDRYNASETLDRPTQDLLALILDAIEAPAIARGELTRAEN